MFKKKIYIKDESRDPIYHVKSGDFTLRSRVLPVSLIAGGFLLLASQVVFPLVYFKSNKTSKTVESSVLGVVSGFRDFEFDELKKSSQPLEDTAPETFLLSIPKLRIKDAVVETNSLTLDPKNALGHYKGSAIPGRPGTAFIYGHSVLPWFFNPKNYKTIFSTLDRLEVEDQIILEIDGKTLTYIVESAEILPPDEVNPLQEYKPEFLNESSVTLMTCVPPGTKMKRLLVHGVLKENR